MRRFAGPMRVDLAKSAGFAFSLGWTRCAQTCLRSRPEQREPMTFSPAAARARALRLDEVTDLRKVGGWMKPAKARDWESGIPRFDLHASLRGIRTSAQRLERSLHTQFYPCTMNCI